MTLHRFRPTGADMEAQSLNTWKIPSAPDDASWGLYVRAIGAGVDHLEVPATGFRLIYLVRGGARLYVRGRRQDLEAGHLVLLDARRGVTLTPDAERPVRAHVVDFGGPHMEHWIGAGFFEAMPCVLRPGFDEALLSLVSSMVELARLRPAGAPRLMAGALAHMLARLEAGSYGGRHSEQQRLIQEARHLLADAKHDRYRLDTIAEELGVSYSWFRQTFRRHAGMPPQRFRLQQRLERACQLLADTQLPVAAIAQELGFSSLAYFSRIFRKETGLTPTLWRKTRL